MTYQVDLKNTLNGFCRWFHVEATTPDEAVELATAEARAKFPEWAADVELATVVHYTGRMD